MKNPGKHQTFQHSWFGCKTHGHLGSAIFCSLAIHFLSPVLVTFKSHIFSMCLVVKWKLSKLLVLKHGQLNHLNFKSSVSFSYTLYIVGMNQIDQSQTTMQYLE